MTQNVIVPMVAVFGIVLTFGAHKFKGNSLFPLLAIIAWLFCLFQTVADYVFLFPFFLGLSAINIKQIIDSREDKRK